MSDKPPTLNYQRPRPRRKRLSGFDAEAWSCLGGCAGAAFAFGSIVVLFLVMINVASRLMERLVISWAYGAQRYGAGLRIVKKNFLLTDGTTLPGRWGFVYIVGVFGCVLLVLGPYVRLMQKLGLLRDGDDAEPPKADS